ncbi:alpha/beta hydrolase [Flammeovirga pectinis]|uniref:Alpha/beta hydrolase n=1 Tax=Flammeovirga pectinis TaxID=2494373 RepID=A0A3S9P862_9BACT|nr:alpha/beta hydrolase [Flammeovirga pectinis]AZQ64386.1 alpha/beta hydrolase [Flammeovirga pectinis]
MNLEKEWKSLEKSYKKEGISMKVNHVEENSIMINYLSVKASEETNLTFVFIHGAPGRANDFSKYLQHPQLRERANILSIERLGYGSNHGVEEDSIAIQAEAIEAVLQDWDRVSHQKQEYILIGHSYGGPIAAYSTLVSKCTIKYLILLAPAMSADLEPMKWYSRWAQAKIIYKILPTSFQVATDEKANHKKALKLVEEEWKLVKVPSMIVHGKKDGIVPFENMKFVRQNWEAPLDSLILEDKGHIFPFTDSDIVVDLLLDKS